MCIGLWIYLLLLLSLFFYFIVLRVVVFSIFLLMLFVVVFVCQVLSIFEAFLKRRGLNTFMSLVKSLVLYSM